MTEEQELALGIDADLGALRKRLVRVQEALKWAVQGRHVHEYIGVLADEIARLRSLLPHKTPVIVTNKCRHGIALDVQCADCALALEETFA